MEMLTAQLPKRMDPAEDSPGPYRKGNRHSQRKTPRSLLLWAALLPFCSALTDVCVSASSLYEHAHQTFLHGYLKDAQEEADRGYHRFEFSHPEWARKFYLLEATAMRWRSLHEDVLALLTEDHLPWVDSKDVIRKLAIEAFSLTRLQRLTEANNKLIEADKLCAGSRSNECGEVLYAHGSLELESGHGPLAKKFFVASEQFGQSTNDGVLRASSLTSLGRAAAEAERHEEALEYYRSAYKIASEIGATPAAQRALEGEGWNQYTLGNFDKAFEIYEAAERHALLVGDTGDEVQVLLWKALIYEGRGQFDLAETADIRAIFLAEKIDNKAAIIDASMDLARFYIGSQRPDEADRYATQARAMVMGATGSQLNILNSDLYAGEAAAMQHDWAKAETLLLEVSAAAESQPSMKWEAQRALGNMYEAQGDVNRAESSYKAALILVEGARNDLKQDMTRLAFLANAAHIYDDYIHFLVTHGKTKEALEAADWSRARTLQQGLGAISGTAPNGPPSFRAADVAKRANATLLFYWLGARQSYLWVASGEKTVLISLPSKSEIAPRIERYRKALLDLKDPVKDGNKDAQALYDVLVAPAAENIAPGRPVVLFADGVIGQLNFETLVVRSPSPHYWIEDATILSAPSIRMFAAARPAPTSSDKMLLFGDAISPSPEYPDLPMAALEVEKIRARFPLSQESVFSHEKATPKAYLASKPEQYSYIHFVSHGTASLVDALDSAVILSRSGAADDSYKLYAREIVDHPINARLVTISACNSVGRQPVVGEGLVGLSWAFLRAGAHNAIGALWEVNDASTPQLMDELYSGLEKGQQPADALRAAKLELLHSDSKYRKPFYWAPFQLYAGR